MLYVLIISIIRFYYYISAFSGIQTQHEVNSSRWEHDDDYSYGTFFKEIICYQILPERSGLGVRMELSGTCDLSNCDRS